MEPTLALLELAGLHPIEIATPVLGFSTMAVALTWEYLRNRRKQRELAPGRPKRSPRWSASRSGRGSPRTAMRAARGLSARPGASRAVSPPSSGTSSTTQTAMASSRAGTSLVLGKSPLGSSTLLSSTRSRTPGGQQRSTSAAAPATGRTAANGGDAA